MQAVWNLITNRDALNPMEAAQSALQDWGFEHMPAAGISQFLLLCFSRGCTPRVEMYRDTPNRTLIVEWREEEEEAFMHRAYRYPENVVPTPHAADPCISQQSLHGYALPNTPLPTISLEPIKPKVVAQGKRRLILTTPKSEDSNKQT